MRKNIPIYSFRPQYQQSCRFNVMGGMGVMGVMGVMGTDGTDGNSRFTDYRPATPCNSLNSLSPCVPAFADKKGGFVDYFWRAAFF